MRSARQAARMAARMAALGGLAAFLLLTAWVCLVAAASVLLATRLGTGLALVLVAGVLLLLALLVLVAVALSRRPAPARQPDVQGWLAKAAVSALSSPAGRKIALLGLAAVLAGAAVLLPGGRSGPGPDGT